MSNYRLLKKMHVRRGEDFDIIYAQKQRMGDEHLLIFATQNSLEHTRFGLSVSKKHGNAVRRNRIKRLLREAFRLLQHRIPTGLDLIFIPRFHSGAGLEEYQKSISSLTRRLAKRLEKRANKKPPQKKNKEV